MAKANNNSAANLGFQDTLWAAADQMRGHMDPSEYKHVVLGLIFLKYISDAFQERYEQLSLWTTDLGNEKLAIIAREPVTAVRRNATIDWSVLESARAKMRTAVKRILRRYGYPSDLRAAATRRVVQQAELFAGGMG